MNRAPFTLAGSAAVLLTMLMSTLSGAANAQTQPTSGMVSVELTNISANIAQRMNVDEAKMPMSIQVPPEVAAVACGITPGPNTPQAAPRGDGCMARQSTPELDRLVASRMQADDTSTMGGPPSKGN